MEISNRLLSIILGDYAILLSTGMRWYVALLFNFLSSLTSLAGFYIAVSIGGVSQEANSWMLAVAAGTFLYISLVDLVRDTTFAINISRERV